MRNALTKLNKQPQREAWPMTLVVPYTLFVLKGGDRYDVREYSGNGLVEHRETILEGDSFILATSVTFFSQPITMILAKEPLVIISTEYDRQRSVNINRIVIERVSDVFGLPALVTTDNIMSWAKDVLNPDSLTDVSLDSVGIYAGIRITREDTERMLDVMQPINELLMEYYDLADERAAEYETALSNRITRSAYSFGEAPTVLQ